MTLAATPAWAPPSAAPTTAPPAARLADALVVPFSSFDHKQDTTPKAKRMRWPTLAAWLQRYDERPKKDGPGWSPALYKEGATRANEGVEALSAAVLDVDHGEPDWTLLEGYEYVAYQTFSHAPDDPRWRIVLPFFRRQPAVGWGETWHASARRCAPTRTRRARTPPACTTCPPARPVRRAGRCTTAAGCSIPPSCHRFPSRPQDRHHAHARRATRRVRAPATTTTRAATWGRCSRATAGGGCTTGARKATGAAPASGRASAPR